MTAVRYGLISDTHGNLHPEVFRLFQGVEAILHAGDVVGDEILDELETIAPTFAVQGNCDVPSARLPAHRILDLAFGRLVLCHSHLFSGGFGHPRRMVRAFASQQPRAIVFGHTHQRHQTLEEGVWLINPGAAGKPRFRDKPSAATLVWNPEAPSLEVEFHALEWKP